MVLIFLRTLSPFFGLNKSNCLRVWFTEDVPCFTLEFLKDSYFSNEVLIFFKLGKNNLWWNSFFSLFSLSVPKWSLIDELTKLSLDSIVEIFFLSFSIVVLSFIISL